MLAEDRKAGIDLAEITWTMALFIGVLQCVAMWPGTSRSLMTIMGGVLAGLTLRSAVEFSFLPGVLTLGAATATDALDSEALMLEHFGATNLFLGFFFAFVSAEAGLRGNSGFRRDFAGFRSMRESVRFRRARFLRIPGSRFMPPKISPRTVPPLLRPRRRLHPPFQAGGWRP